MDEVERSSAVVLGVGIKTETAPLHADTSRFLARSTVMMRDRGTDTEYFFGGASVGTDKGAAASTSQFEVVERVFAMPVFHRATSRFDVFDYFSGEARGTVDPSLVLITSKRAVGHKDACGDPSCRGAVGLGLGPTQVWAKRHGLFESVERHLRSSVWYRNVRLKQAPEETLVGEEYVLRRYGLADASTPFCLSVVSGGRDGVFYVGSAVQESFSLAANKADNEALMMLDNHLAGRDGQANTKRSKDRFLALSGEGARAASAYFESRVVGRMSAVDTRCYSEREVVDALLGPQADVRWAPLMARESLHLVRVFSPDLTWENRDRVAFPDCAVLDPYC